MALESPLSDSPQEECTLSNKLMSVVLFCALTLTVTAMAGPRKVEMPGFAGKHLKRMMRGHLETLQEVTRLLAQHQYEKAANIAEEGLGMSSADMHFKFFIGKYMPEDMRVHGEGMHEAATRFAKDARDAAQGDELDRTLASLANIMNQCVSCHSTYRLRESGK